MAHDSPPSGAASFPAELLRSVAAGAPEAVDVWFRAEHPEVYRLCFGFLAHRAEAEDVAQDAMLRILEKLPEFDLTRPYRPWRTTLVLNRCRDRLRRSEARRGAEEKAALARTESVLPDPGDSALRGEVEEVLRKSLAALPPREREVFVLRDLEGIETAEVARALAIGESSVRSLLALARRRLRELLGERIGGGGR